MTQNRGVDRDLVIDTMASWALEGMEADQETLADIRALVDGTITIEEFDRRTRVVAANG